MTKKAEDTKQAPAPKTATISVEDKLEALRGCVDGLRSGLLMLSEAGLKACNAGDITARQLNSLYIKVDQIRDTIVSVDNGAAQAIDSLNARFKRLQEDVIYAQHNPYRKKYRIARNIRHDGSVDKFYRISQWCATNLGWFSCANSNLYDCRTLSKRSAIRQFKKELGASGLDQCYIK